MKNERGRSTRAARTWSVAFGLLFVVMTGPSSAALAAQESRPAGYSVKPDARGVWAFVAPDGTRFFSLGVNNVSPSAWNPRPETRLRETLQA